MSDATFTASVAGDTSSHDHHHEEGVATPMGVALFLIVVVAVVGAVIYGSFVIGPWVLGLTALATVPLIYLALILLTTGR